MGIVYFIMVGLIAGWLAGQLVKGGGFGVLGDIVVGMLGALVGGFLFHAFGMHMARGLLGIILEATLGAVVLIAILRIVKQA